jgi:hypothetical protein
MLGYTENEKTGYESILDFRFSPCAETCMFSFGFFIQPLKMDLTEGSETSAKLNLTPGKYPKENIQGYESISADHTVTDFISFRCVKANKKDKMRIHPISGHSP